MMGSVPVIWYSLTMRSPSRGRLLLRAEVAGVVDAAGLVELLEGRRRQRLDEVVDGRAPGRSGERPRLMLQRVPHLLLERAARQRVVGSVARHQLEPR